MMPGRLVSLVGEGDTLLLVTHSGHQTLAYSQYRVGVPGVSHCHPATPTLPLPLSPGRSRTACILPFTPEQFQSLTSTGLASRTPGPQ
mgnify:CR=1 FL=1